MDILLQLAGLLPTPGQLFFCILLGFLAYSYLLYGKRLKEIVTHPRNRFQSWLFAALFVLVLLLFLIPRTLPNLPAWLAQPQEFVIRGHKFQTTTCGLLQTASLTLFFVSCIWYLRSCKGPSFAADRYLQTYRQLLQEGAFLEAKQLEQPMPWYFLTKADKNASPAEPNFFTFIPTPIPERSGSRSLPSLYWIEHILTSFLLDFINVITSVCAAGAYMCEKSKKNTNRRVFMVLLWLEKGRIDKGDRETYDGVAAEPQKMEKRMVKIDLITGFLGSGKTTFL